MADQDAAEWKGKPVALWSVSDVQAWFVSLKLTKYNDLLNENDINGELLLVLGKDEFDCLGIENSFHQKKIHISLKRLEEEEAAKSANLERILQPGTAGSTDEADLPGISSKFSSNWGASLQRLDSISKQQEPISRSNPELPAPEPQSAGQALFGAQSLVGDPWRSADPSGSTDPFGDLSRPVNGSPSGLGPAPSALGAPPGLSGTATASVAATTATTTTTTSIIHGSSDLNGFVAPGAAPASAVALASLPFPLLPPNGGGSLLAPPPASSSPATVTNQTNDAVAAAVSSPPLSSVGGGGSSPSLLGTTGAAAAAALAALTLSGSNSSLPHVAPTSALSAPPSTLPSTAAAVTSAAAAAAAAPSPSLSLSPSAQLLPVSAAQPYFVRSSRWLCLQGVEPGVSDAALLTLLQLKGELRSADLTMRPRGVVIAAYFHAASASAARTLLQGLPLQPALATVERKLGNGGSGEQPAAGSGGSASDSGWDGSAAAAPALSLWLSTKAAAVGAECRRVHAQFCFPCPEPVMQVAAAAAATGVPASNDAAAASWNEGAVVLVSALSAADSNSGSNGSGSGSGSGSGGGPESAGLSRLRAALAAQCGEVRYVAPSPPSLPLCADAEFWDTRSAAALLRAGGGLAVQGLPQLVSALPAAAPANTVTVVTMLRLFLMSQPLLTHSGAAQPFAGVAMGLGSPVGSVGVGGVGTPLGSPSAAAAAGNGGTAVAQLQQQQQQFLQQQQQHLSNGSFPQLPLPMAAMSMPLMPGAYGMPPLAGAGAGGSMMAAGLGGAAAAAAAAAAGGSAHSLNSLPMLQQAQQMQAQQMMLQQSSFPQYLQMPNGQIMLMPPTSLSAGLLPQPAPYQMHQQQQQPSRRNRGNGSNDSKFTVDVNLLASGADRRSSFMIRNVPNRYTQQLLLEELRTRTSAQFDFFYLPIDFSNGCSMGYAFINLVSPQACVEFFTQFHASSWKLFGSTKTCAVTFARIQGKGAMIARFQNSTIMSRHESYRPLCFYSDGPMQGQPQPFPAPSIAMSSPREQSPPQQQQQHLSASALLPHFTPGVPVAAAPGSALSSTATPYSPTG